MTEPGEPPRWRPTAALTSALLVGTALLLLAVGLHRRDLFALAVPLLVAVAVASLRTPATPTVELHLDERTLLEGQEIDTTIHVTGADLATATLAGSPVVRPDRRARTGWPGPLTTTVRAVRWGRADVGPAEVLVGAWDGLLACRLTTRAERVRVLPFRARFSAPDAIPRAAGIIGAHRSRRPGEGGDFAGVRPFAAGDRLKRINWPVSLRTGALHVSATYSDRDTTILLVVDSSQEVGAGDGGDSSLDITVRAAAAVAEHYLRGGDRVGLLDYARPLRHITPAAGRAHLNRILDTLLDVAPSPVVEGTSARVLERLAARAVVIVLTPLVDAGTRDRAAALAQSGHTVLLVDTIPPQPDTGGQRKWTSVARELQDLQRASGIHRLTDRGLPVVTWRGPGSLDEVLFQLSRAAVAPKVRR